VGEKTKVILMLIDWHESMAESLSQPILPDNMEEGERNERLQEIKGQIKEHTEYAHGLRSLLAIRHEQRNNN
jgi:hypothetical protein